jgi:hypothetical protein
MEELIKYLSEKLDVDVSKISATSHLIDDLDSDDWTNLEVIIEVGENSIALLLTKKLMALKQYKISLISLVTNVSS